jgi:hypothetical protein
MKIWKIKETEEFPASDANSMPYTYAIYERQ